MDTLGRSLECNVVQALEERIWLDRREDACAFFPAKGGALQRLRSWFRDLRARGQLGPVADGETWLDRR